MLVGAPIIASNSSTTWTIGGYSAVTSKQNRKIYVHLPMTKGGKCKIRMPDGTILAEGDSASSPVRRIGLWELGGPRYHRTRNDIAFSPRRPNGQARTNDAMSNIHRRFAETFVHIELSDGSTRPSLRSPCSKFDSEDDVSFASPPNSVGSSNTTISSIHEHRFECSTFSTPPEPNTYALLRRACLQTLSGEPSPRGLVSGPSSFEVPANAPIHQPPGPSEAMEP